MDRIGTTCIGTGLVYTFNSELVGGRALPNQCECERTVRGIWRMGELHSPADKTIRSIAEAGHALTNQCECE